jgi:hypothetical protein
MTEGTWSACGMILTGKAETLEETPFSMQISLPQITQRIVWN